MPQYLLTLPEGATITLVPEGSRVDTTLWKVPASAPEGPTQATPTQADLRAAFLKAVAKDKLRAFDVLASVQAKKISEVPESQFQTVIDNFIAIAEG
jgi:hypothetical protein